MNVTVIIPTYNRGEKVLNVLESLERQTFKDFEVVIVNDGSTDNTKEILDSKTGQYNLNIRVIHQANGGRAQVRNRGANEAKDGLLIFMDDDMRHNEHAIQLHVSHHLLTPDTILVGNTLEDLKLAKTDVQKYKAYLSNKWSDILASHKGPLNRSNLHITAANFSISKSLFLELKGFDQGLNDIEDYDFAMRAYNAGIPIYYNPDIIGWHDDFITCKSYVSRKKQYLKAHAMVQLLRPNLYQQFDRKPNEAPGFIKKLFYKALKGSVWIDLVDADLLIFLPRSIRYKLYGAIIYANSFN